MCTEIHNMKTGEEATSPNEFAAMLGCEVSQLVVAEEYGGTPVDPECCLCQVDVTATLREHGWRFDKSHDPMDVDAWPPDSAAAP